jgi:hypothetical protein
MPGISPRKRTLPVTITTESIKQEHLFEVHHSIVGSLKSLGQWNAERKLYWDAVRERVQHPEFFSNGLKCPQCFNGNLYDTGNATSRAPVMLRVKCQSCDFKGERFE